IHQLPPATRQRGSLHPCGESQLERRHSCHVLLFSRRPREDASDRRAESQGFRERHSGPVRDGGKCRNQERLTEPLDQQPLMLLTRGNKITWLGHSTFQIATPSGKVILIDPWVMGNPACPAGLKKLARVDVMLITHGHSDHFADAMALARAHKPE